jgi:hypothetical protein
MIYCYLLLQIEEVITIAGYYLYNITVKIQFTIRVESCRINNNVYIMANRAENLLNLTSPANV